MSQTRKWSALAVLAVAVVFVASWFLLVAPKRGAAADLRQQTSDQQAANSALVQKLAVLKAQAADLPKRKAELALVRQQIPDNPALPSLVRDLTAAGRAAGVTVLSLAPATPTPVVLTAAQPVAATGAAAAPALYQVPFTLKVTGSYFETEQFVNRLEKLRRAFLVTGFSLKALDATTSTGTTGPPVNPGDLQLDLSGRVFLAPPVAATAAAPVAGTGTAASTATTAQ